MPPARLVSDQSKQNRAGSQTKVPAGRLARTRSEGPCGEENGIMPSWSSPSSFDEAAAGTRRLGNGSARYDPGPGIRAPIPMSAYEPMRQQVKAWQKSELTDVTGQGGHLRSVCGGQTRSSQTPCPDRACLYFEVRGIPAANERLVVSKSNGPTTRLICGLALQIESEFSCLCSAR